MMVSTCWLVGRLTVKKRMIKVWSFWKAEGARDSSRSCDLDAEYLRQVFHRYSASGSSTSGPKWGINFLEQHELSKQYSTRRTRR